MKTEMHPSSRTILKLIDDATYGVAQDDLSARVAGKWSAAEVLEHLSITFDLTAKGLKKTLVKGPPVSAKKTVKQRALSFVVLTLGHFPSGRKAPAVTLPKGLNPELVLPFTKQNLERLDEILAQCQDQFGSRKKFGDHPVLGPLNINEWRRFHTVHTRHHMKVLTARLRSNTRRKGTMTV